MTQTNRLAVMIDGEVGISVSETVIVTESGAEPVGTIPREIAGR